MKPLTNILLVAFLIVYLFFPFFNVDFYGAWTGIKYTAETLTSSESLVKELFSLVPFVAGFCGIAVNCMKNRYWGLLVAAFCALGIYFYIDAKALVNIQLPQFFAINSLGYGFNIGYGLLIAALVSALVSVLPLKINKFLARELSFISKKKKAAQAEAPQAAPAAEEEAEPAPEPEETQEPREEKEENPYAAYMPKPTPDEN